jgi:citrate synthase
MNDFKPGLEGVVAFQTEIAEPDREGGALRYRGVDIEELVGQVSYEKVWGLLVDESLEPGMPDPEPHDPVNLTGNAPADLQAETARLSSVWNLRKLVDIDDQEARDDLARLSAQMMSIVAKSAAVHDGREPAPDEVVAQGETAAAKFLLRWRGEADPDHVKAIDTYWICTSEHGLNASTFTARITASTGADTGAAMSAAVGALSGPLHGGAPARVLPMLDEVGASGDPDGYVRDILDSQGRIMGFGHRVYRAEDPRSRILKRTAQELGSPRFEVAEALEEAALAALHERKPDYVIATNVEFYSAVVLDVAEVPPDLTPAMFASARVAGWAVGAVHRPRVPLALNCLSSRQPRPKRPPSPKRATRKASPACGRAGRTRSRMRPVRATIASERSRTARSANSATARRSSCCGGASRTRARRAGARP